MLVGRVLKDGSWRQPGADEASDEGEIALLVAGVEGDIDEDVWVPESAARRSTSWPRQKLRLAGALLASCPSGGLETKFALGIRAGALCRSARRWHLATSQGQDEFLARSGNREEARDLVGGGRSPDEDHLRHEVSLAGFQ